jgi:hypothetical protein
MYKYALSVPPSGRIRYCPTAPATIQSRGPSLLASRLPPLPAVCTAR